MEHRGVTWDRDSGGEGRSPRSILPGSEGLLDELEQGTHSLRIGLEGKLRRPSQVPPLDAELTESHDARDLTGKVLTANPSHPSPGFRILPSVGQVH